MPKTPSPPREQTFDVYKVRYRLAIQDPDVPGTRYHTVIFVETEKDTTKSGWIHHVTGDLTSSGGMYYERKQGRRPETSGTFVNKELLGKVSASKYPLAFNEVCSAQPAPLKQKSFNIKTKKTEPVKPDGTFYEPGEEHPPLRKCTEWTEQQAIPALSRAGLLV